MDEQEDLKSLLLKKANGYDVEEVVEEYSDVDGELVLVKKKITHKYIPPDTALLKLLVESKDEENEDLSNYTEEELKQMLKDLVKDEN